MTSPGQTDLAQSRYHCIPCNVSIQYAVTGRAKLSIHSRKIFKQLNINYFVWNLENSTEMFAKDVNGSMGDSRDHKGPHTVLRVQIDNILDGCQSNIIIQMEWN